MKLRGIEMPAVTGMSGVEGIFGEGYPIHRLWKLMFPKGFNFSGMGFVAKTVTLNKRAGNMPLKNDGLTPKRWKPDCIYLDFPRGLVLNAVGLSNFGFRFYLEQERWQKREDVFTLSYMAMSDKDKSPVEQRKQRIRETIAFVEEFRDGLPGFKGKVVLQDNLTCPNTGHRLAMSPREFNELCEETEERIPILASAGIPVVTKINVLFPTEVAHRIMAISGCDALCVSNTIPWGEIPDKVDWRSLFGTLTSPLEKYGGGGLSGGPLFPVLLWWLNSFEAGIKPLMVGGGIMGPKNVQSLSLLKKQCNIQGISLGTIAILRMWRVAETIAAGHLYFGT